MEWVVRAQVRCQSQSQNGISLFLRQNLMISILIGANFILSFIHSTNLQSVTIASQCQAWWKELKVWRWQKQSLLSKTLQSPTGNREGADFRPGRIGSNRGQYCVSDSIFESLLLGHLSVGWRGDLPFCPQCHPICVWDSL